MGEDRFAEQHMAIACRHGDPASLNVEVGGLAGGIAHAEPNGAHVNTGCDLKEVPQYGEFAEQHPERSAEERADRLAPAAHSEEAVAVGVGEGERVVDDVAVAVPRLPVQRVGHERVGAHHAADQRVVDPAVQMHEADIGQLLLAGEAARGLASAVEVAGRVVGAVGEAPLAPGVVAQAFGDGAALVGDDCDRAEIIRMAGDGEVKLFTAAQRR